MLKALIFIVFFAFIHVGAGSVMVFAPHPDDDILGCGGSIVRHKRDGDSVTIVYITSGDADSWKGITGTKLAEIREVEAKKAADRIGAKKLIFLRQLDTKVSYYSAEHIKKIQELLLEHQPTYVYIPHADDEHDDHKATFRLVSQALSEALKVEGALKQRPIVLCYEVWTPLSKISHKVDISKYMDLKIKALSEHKSQLADVNFTGAIKALNKYRGIMLAQVEYMECFNELKNY